MTTTGDQRTATEQATGGPGLADPPATVDLYAFKPPRRASRGVER